MHAQQAISFLKQNLPFKPDISEREFTQLGEAVQALILDPREESVPLLTQVLGQYDQGDLNEPVIKALSHHPLPLIHRHILLGLESADEERRDGCAEAAGFFPHLDFIQPLLRLMQSPLPPVRYLAANSLERVMTDSFYDTIKGLYEKERDNDIRTILAAMMKPMFIQL